MKSRLIMPLGRRAGIALLAAVACLFVAGPPARVAGQDPGVRMVPVEGEAAQYWTRWRGPSGQGLVSGSGYVDRWSATENVRWKVAVPGEGNSSPIVWRDQILLTTAYPDGRLSVLSFRRTDGSKQLETVVPAPRTRAHQKNGHASATVSTDGTRVYASFGSVLVALGLDGKIAWRQELGSIANYHGPAGSPLLYRDRVIVYQDQSRNSFIGAFDSTTGKALWRTARDASVGWGTPVAIRLGSRDEIIVNGQDRVRSYDPARGTELWSCRGSSFEVIPTPVVGAGLVFCSSGRVGPTLAIRPGGSGDVTTSHVAWASPRGSPFVPSPILVGDVLYMVNDMASVVTALEATTGRSLWQGRLGVATREGFSASPVAVDGKVFFTNDEGETFVLRAGRTFELLHTNRIGERTLASPALVDGRWYIRTEGHLVAIGAK
jgi:outer membrane protein assembly factor BamB